MLYSGIFISNVYNAHKETHLLISPAPLVSMGANYNSNTGWQINVEDNSVHITRYQFKL